MATEKDLINGNSRKKKFECTEGSKDKDIKRKKLKDAGEAYVSRKGVQVPAISPPTPSESQICKCSHQCHKLTFEDKLALFNFYHQKTYDEQSEYIVYHCMSLIEPKRRKVDKSISQRQATFLYQLQLGPKIVSVCQRTLCSVLGVTPRRIQVLQSKIKNANQVIDLSDKRGKHVNRPHRVSEETIRKIQEHVSSVRRHEMNYYCKGTSVKKPLNPELTSIKMYQLFCDKYPEEQVSRKIYNSVWRKINTGLNQADLSDDPINDRLSSQNNFTIVKCEAEPVRDSLEADGQLGRIKAEMRTEVMKLLDGSNKSSNVKRPKSPHDVLLLNELIREYLDWIGYKYTSNVLVAECELGKQPLDRSFLAQDLGVKETEKSQSLPLLFCLIETFKELKASSMSSC